MQYILMFFLFFSFPISLLAQNQVSPSTLTQSLIQQILQTGTDANQETNAKQPSQLQVKEPALPQIQETSKPESTPSLTQEKIKPVLGTIFIDEKQYFSGQLHIPDFSITITNEYKNKEFIKELPLSQIKTLTCIQWSAFVLDKENHSFQFVCSLYNIKDQAGYSFVYKKPIPALQKILFESNMGSTVFYSYFVDYQEKKTWSNLKLPISQTLTEQPLQGVIRTIQLGELDKKQAFTSVSPHLPLITEKTPQNQPKPKKLNPSPAKPTNKSTKTTKSVAKNKKRGVPPTISKKSTLSPSPPSKKTSSNKKLTNIPTQKHKVKNETSDEKAHIRSRR